MSDKYIKICQGCGHENDDRNASCFDCGAWLTDEKRYGMSTQEEHLIEILRSDINELKIENRELHKIIVEARGITCGWRNTGIVLPFEVDAFNHNSRLDLIESLVDEKIND